MNSERIMCIVSKNIVYYGDSLVSYDIKQYHKLYSVFGCECGNIMKVFYTVCEYPFGCLNEEIDKSVDCKITRFLAS